LAIEKKTRSKGIAEGVLVRIPDDLLASIDELRRKADDLPTRPEMIRRLLASHPDLPMPTNEGN
jgi:hypothetical protein